MVKFIPRSSRRQRGVTLIETVIFLVALSIALTGLARVFKQQVTASVDPVLRLYALEQAQSLLDEILARKYDGQTPTGGIPACGTTIGPPCAGISADSTFDDVGDYHGYTRVHPNQFRLAVAVEDAGGELGLAADQARRVTVSINMPNEHRFVLSAYKVNF